MGYSTSMIAPGMVLARNTPSGLLGAVMNSITLCALALGAASLH